MNKREKFDYKELGYDYLTKTEYDNLFEDKIRARGKIYYQNKQIENFKKEKSNYSAIVHGTKKYNVNISIYNNKIKVLCECPYHKDTNIYCKHIYAVLLQIHNEPLKIKMRKSYDENLKMLEELLSNIEKNVKENDKYLIKMFSKDLAKNRPEQIKNNIETLKNNFDLDNDWRLTCATNLSYLYLNDAIEKYNNIIDDIEYGKKELKRRKNEKPISVTYSFDDSVIFDAVDKKLANIPSNKLEYVKEEMIKKGEDIELINRAIKNSKTREKQIKRIENKKKGKSFFTILDVISNIVFFPIKIFFALVIGLNESSIQSKSSTLKKEMDNYGLEEWQKDLVRKKEYNPWNFEEEDLEDDDYYYEDDK